MQTTDPLIEYFIEHTNERFDKLEEKVDRLIGFRFLLIGAAAVVSFMASILFQILITALNK